MNAVSLGALGNFRPFQGATELSFTRIDRRERAPHGNIQA
jgi:hypothetical protein